MTNKKPCTYVLFVIDRSSSMGSTKKQAVDSFNEQVDQMKENAKEQDIFVSMVTFNQNVYEHSWNEKVDNLGHANYDEFIPAGCTALYDAMGYGIQKLHDTTDYENEDNSYLVISISDGYENSSSQYNPSMLKEIIQDCQNSGRWTFTYMGCDANCLNQIANATGILRSNMAMWDNKSGLNTKNGLGLNSAKTQGYFTARSRGAKSVDTFHSKQLGQVADYTSGEDRSVDIDSQKEVQQSCSVSVQALGRSFIKNTEHEEPQFSKPFVYKESKNNLPKYKEVSYKRQKGASLFANSEQISFQ